MVESSAVGGGVVTSWDVKTPLYKSLAVLR